MNPLSAFGVPLVLAVVSGLPSVTAQDTPTNIPMVKDSPLSKEANRLAMLGGGARYCKLDKDVQEEYFVKAQAKLNKMAQDKYEKIFVSVEFKNLLISHSIKKPTDSCNKILNTVKIFSRTAKLSL